MRRCLILALVLALASCKIPTQPEWPHLTDSPQRGFDDIFVLNSPIPRANYDALFFASLRDANFSGADSTRRFNDEFATFYNSMGDVIRDSMDHVKLYLNGVDFNYWGWGTVIPLDFPQPVIWQLSGDDYFPSFRHPLASEPPIAILSPTSKDTVDVTQPFELRYSAPEADSVTVVLFYTGIADRIYRDSVAIDSFALSEFRYLVPNSGTFTVPAFALGRDTAFYSNFRPQGMTVSVAWAIGDTLHVGSRLFGFVTECARSISYDVKP